MNNIFNVPVLLIVIALIAGLTAPTVVLQAYADPKEPNGKCFLEKDKGAKGCAGNIGGFIQTPKGRCIEQNTPFSDFHGSCP